MMSGWPDTYGGWTSLTHPKIEKVELVARVFNHEVTRDWTTATEISCCSSSFGLHFSIGSVEEIQLDNENVLFIK